MACRVQVVAPALDAGSPGHRSVAASDVERETEAVRLAIRRGTRAIRSRARAADPRRACCGWPKRCVFLLTMHHIVSRRLVDACVRAGGRRLLRGVRARPAVAAHRAADPVHRFRRLAARAAAAARCSTSSSRTGDAARIDVPVLGAADRPAAAGRAHLQRRASQFSRCRASCATRSGR